MRAIHYVIKSAKGNRSKDLVSRSSFLFDNVLRQSLSNGLFWTAARYQKEFPRDAYKKKEVERLSLLNALSSSRNPSFGQSINLWIQSVIIKMKIISLWTSSGSPFQRAFLMALKTSEPTLRCHQIPLIGALWIQHHERKDKKTKKKNYNNKGKIHRRKRPRIR